MDDLISRQDAVKSMTNAIWHYPNEMYAQLNSYEMAEALAKDGLMFIPSAQQWIPCSERLPDVEQPVLISVHGRVFDAVYKGLSSDHTPVWLSHGCVYWAEEVSRWMPMPEPFEGGEK